MHTHTRVKIDGLLKAWTDLMNSKSFTINPMMPDCMITNSNPWHLLESSIMELSMSRSSP